eukprot:scaffold3537_cov167-Amphora_coffeaeformis.AAC.3
MKFTSFPLVLAALGYFDAARAQATTSNPLQGLYGKGLVISHDDDTFWQVKGGNTLKLVEEPEEFYSRFFVTQGQSAETVFVRMGKFEYICVEPGSGNLIRIPASHVEDETVNAGTCEFNVKAILGEESVSANKLDKPDTYVLQATSNGRYLQKASTSTDDIVKASAVSESNASVLRIRDERDVIVDLGFLEQFLSNGKEGNDIPTIFAKDESGRLMEHKADTDKIAWANTNKNNARSRWTVTRMSRLNNIVRFQNVGSTEHFCVPDSGPNEGRAFGGQFVNVELGLCDWIPVRVNERQYVLFNPKNDKFTRVLDTAREGMVDSPFASGAETITFELAEPRAAAIEILDVQFDRAAIDTLSFTPDEIKTVQFKNASPVSQEQVVEFSETETITTETTWSTSFAAESSFSIETELGGFFASSTVTASLTIGFSTEQGRTHSTSEEKTVSYSKTFEVPACTDMSISIATAAVQKATVPFIATIRQNNVDGSFKVFQQTGSHTGISLDQTQVSVEVTPIEGCIPQESARRLRGSI